MAKRAGYLFPTLITGLLLLLLPLLPLHVSGQTLKLPPPTGPFMVGTLEMQLYDNRRTDLLAPTPTPRTFMVQLFYPLKNDTAATKHNVASYMKPLAARVYEAEKGLPPDSLTMLESNSLLGATLYVPEDNTTNVIIFSPGFQISRVFYTSILEEVASRGYVVIAIDHTYDAEAVEMIDGSVVMGRFAGISEQDLDPSEVAQAFFARTDDVVYIIDALWDIMSRVPGFTDFVDIARLGLFGHSFGGAVAAEVSWIDGRVWGGLNMDGDFYGEVVSEGLNKPFMYMDAPHGDDVVRNPAQAQLWNRLRSWRRHVRISGVRHLSYSDLPVLTELLGLVDIVPGDVYEGLYGTAGAMRSALVVKTFVSAFFDYLFGRGESVLLSNELNEEWPEVSFPMGRDF